MKNDCRRFQENLRRWTLDQDPQALRDLESHAASCRDCGRDWNLESELSAAAKTLVRDWESPYLWTRIRSDLQSSRNLRAPWWRALPFPSLLTACLLLAAVGAAAWLALPSAGGLLRGWAGDPKLLSERALRQTEDAEREYAAAIDRLENLARDRLEEQPDDPLLASYRERLALIDEAIAECRRQIEENRFNAHLRQQMLVLYRDKRQTIADILNEETTQP